MENDKSIVLSAMGHFHPENKIPNDFFDELDIGTDAAWLEERTGIESRSSVLQTEDILALRHEKTNLDGLRRQGRVTPLSALAKPAWARLVERHPSGNQDLHESIDTLICGTSVPDYDIPANACSIAGELGFHCPSWDLNSACSTFIVNLHVARGLLMAQRHKRIAIFNPERYSMRMNYTDRSTCILFGDGCSAATIELDEGEGDPVSGLEVLDTWVESDPSRYDLVTIEDGGTFQQSGKAVQKFAISRTIDITRRILERNGLTPEDISWFTGHQANLRMVESAANRLGIPSEKHLYNVHKFGNQGAAGAPSVLSQNWEKFKPGDLVAVSVVGSGLTWASALLRCR